MNKTILLAAFIFPERVTWFLSYLETKFGIEKGKVFCYKNIEDESKVIMTFKISYNEDKPLNLKDLFPSAIPIHKKGDALYTINALNMLIEKNTNLPISATENKKTIIDWELYQNKLMVVNGKELTFLNICRVF